MSAGGFLTAVGIGASVTLAIVTGNCSTNQRISSDLNTTVSALGDRIDGQFREAAEERRDEHGQIIDRVGRLEDLHLKPTEPAQQ